MSRDPSSHGEFSFHERQGGESSWQQLPRQLRFGSRTGRRLVIDVNINHARSNHEIRTLQVHQVGWILRDGGGIVDLSDSAARATEVKRAGRGISETFGASANTNSHAHQQSSQSCARAIPVDFEARKVGCGEAYTSGVRSHGGYLFQPAN